MKHRMEVLLLAVVLAPTLGGCQVFRHGKQALPAEPPPKLVDVGGAVEHAGSIEIPATGLSLVQAITRAGSLRLGEAHDQNWFVSLQRGGLGRQQSYLMPLQMVEQDVAGKIPLRPGDLIQVLRFDSTGLKIEDKARSAPIRVALAGLIPRPGQYTIDKDSQIIDLLGDEPGGGDPLRNGASIAALTRTNGLTTEHYLLPLAYGEYRDLHPKSGDIITFTRPERIPLVLSGFLEDLRRNIIQQDEAVEPAHPLQELHDETWSTPVLEHFQSAHKTVAGLLPF